MCVCVCLISKRENEKRAQMQHHNRLYGNSIMKEFVPMVIRAVPREQFVEGMRGGEGIIFDIFGFSINITQQAVLHMVALLNSPSFSTSISPAV